MAQTASPETSGSSFVTPPKEHEPQRDRRNARVTHSQHQCNYCGQVAPLVWVHGHGQCASCGINVEECCRGESCDLGGADDSRWL